MSLIINQLFSLQGKTALITGGSSGLGEGIDITKSLPISMAAPAVFAQTTPGQKKPNVVFILADNVDYSDLGSYGG